jgi:hypothetical protein
VLEVARLPNVTVQVVPYSAGAHPALDSTFNILEFTAPVPNVVYVEGLVGWIFIERPEDINRYHLVFDRLRAMAHSAEKSADLIRKFSTAYGAGLRAVL